MEENQKEVLEPEQPIDDNLLQKQPTKLKIETIGISEKDIGEQKIESRKVEKHIKSKATVNNLIKVLDDTDVTQDDILAQIRYFTRERIFTIRLPKKVLAPIYLEFVNKKLKGAE